MVRQKYIQLCSAKRFAQVWNVLHAAILSKPIFVMQTTKAGCHLNSVSRSEVIVFFFAVYFSPEATADRTAVVGDKLRLAGPQLRNSEGLSRNPILSAHHRAQASFSKPGLFHNFL